MKHLINPWAPSLRCLSRGIGWVKSPQSLGKTGQGKPACSLVSAALRSAAGESSNSGGKHTTGRLGRRSATPVAGQPHFAFLILPVIEQSSQQHHETGTRVMYESACGRIEDGRHRRSAGSGAWRTVKYMLDTNMIAFARNRRPEAVLEQLLKQRPEDVCISSITLAELEYGACHSSRPEQNRLALLLFLSEISVFSFEENAAREYGMIRQDLTQKGQLIGGNDLLIAAHARSLNLTLVTNNTREFERVAGLKLENWAS